MKLIDLTGKNFGRWTVESRFDTNGKGNAKWNCLCSCGTRKIVEGKTLKKGESQSCGCLRLELVSPDLTGNKFGRLTVIERCESSNNNGVWLCECECGEKTKVVTNTLTSGHTKSCGCFAKEIVKVINFKHGNSKRSGETDEYSIWCGMTKRCFNQNASKYADYGGRGITVCDRWKDFNNFLEDMGNRPSKKHSIDRIDVNGNYEPTNCRWATIIEQSRNKRTHPNSKTGVSGVTTKNGKWIAYISVNKKQIHLGIFSNFDEAVKIRKKAEEKLWGKSS